MRVTGLAPALLVSQSCSEPYLLRALEASGGPDSGGRGAHRRSPRAEKGSFLSSLLSGSWEFPDTGVVLVSVPLNRYLLSSHGLADPELEMSQKTRQCGPRTPDPDKALLFQGAARDGA